MSTDPVPTRCFRCGGPADQLNELEEGRNCPACAERLLETLSGVFHSPWGHERAPLADEVVEEFVARGPRRLGPSPAPYDDDPPRRA